MHGINERSKTMNIAIKKNLLIKQLSERNKKLEEKIKALEEHAYWDGMTGLRNRNFGMFTLENWLREKKEFSLIFADLDNLKYINDNYGHEEGDNYIISAANHLKESFPGSVVCRLGGDEFLLLAPDMQYNEARENMNLVCLNVQHDKHLEGKEYEYRVSFGIVFVDKDNVLPSSNLLSIADGRMYENKRMRKYKGRDKGIARRPNYAYGQ